MARRVINSQTKTYYVRGALGAVWLLADRVKVTESGDLLFLFCGNEYDDICLAVAQGDWSWFTIADNDTDYPEEESETILKFVESYNEKEMV